jgi:tRNA nucleotidyltransferase/poly(A) polymerase
VVGGAVRDLLLGAAPKDVDLLTSATLRDIRALLPRSVTVGVRHPIVQAEVSPGCKVDISSMHTGAAIAHQPSHEPHRHRSGQQQQQQQHSWAAVRRANAAGADAAPLAAGVQACVLATVSAPQSAPGAPMTPCGNLAPRPLTTAGRDFSVNTLLWDPLAGLLYDYAGGMADITARLLRACGEPTAAFANDPARVLRGVRVAARAGGALTLSAPRRCAPLHLTSPANCGRTTTLRLRSTSLPTAPTLPLGLTIEVATEAAMRAEESIEAVAALPPARLRLEVDQLMSYGASARSLQLLAQLGLLPRLLPSHASAFSSRDGGLEGTPLLAVLRVLDERVSPSRRAPPEAVAALLVATLARARLQEECAQEQQEQHQQQQQAQKQEEGQQQQQQQQQQHHAEPGSPEQGWQEMLTHAWPLARQGLAVPGVAPGSHGLHTSPASKKRCLSLAAAGMPWGGDEHARLHEVAWDVATEVSTGRGRNLTGLEH